MATRVGAIKRSADRAVQYEPEIWKLFNNWDLLNNLHWFQKEHRCGICGSFFLSLSFSRSQVIMKKSSNDTFFCSKRGIECNGNDHHLREIWQCCHLDQIMMFSHKKVDVLRAREQEQEKKGTTNSVSSRATNNWICVFSLFKIYI